MKKFLYYGRQSTSALFTCLLLGFFLVQCKHSTSEDPKINTPKPDTHSGQPVKLNVDFSALIQMTPAASLQTDGKDIFTVQGSRMAATDSHLFFADSNAWKIIDISNIASSQILYASPEIRATNILLNGSILLVNEGSDLDAFNISNLSSPVFVRGIKNNLTDISKWILRDNRVYAAGYSSGFAIIDVANPAEMTVLSYRIKSTDSKKTVSMDIHGTVAYVAEIEFPEMHRLSTFDFSNPESPALLGTFKYFPEDVIYHNGYVYIAESFAIKIVNAANPANLVEMGFIDVPMPLSEMHLDGNFLYVFDLGRNLNVYDITDVNAIKGIGRYKFESHMVSKTTNSKYLFVRTEENGIVVFSKL